MAFWKLKLNPKGIEAQGEFDWETLFFKHCKILQIWKDGCLFKGFSWYFNFAHWSCCEYLRDTAISISLMVRSEPLKPITCRLLQLTLLAIKTILPPSKNSQPLGIKHTSLTTSTWQTLHYALKLSGLISGLQLVVCLCLRALSFLSYFQLFISIIKKKRKRKRKNENT